MLATSTSVGWLPATSTRLALPVWMRSSVQRAVVIPSRRCTIPMGYALAMLVAKAVRLRNLAGTQLGKNLFRVDDVYRWTFAATETKTGEVIDALLPPRLTPYIERWITHHRRLLLQGAEHDAMWISIKGTPMGRADVYERVCITTRQELGIRINPHAFRHIVAPAWRCASRKRCA